MRMSDQIDQIAPALLKAQQTIKPVHKTATNTFFKNKYATLDTIMDVALEACGANGITILQDAAEGGPEGFRVDTTLLHSSGQWVSGGVWVPVAPETKKDGSVLPRNAQGACSGVTYARRYSLCAMLGVVPDDDDDGNMASGKATTSANTAAVNPALAALVKDSRWTEDERRALLRRGAKITTEDGMDDLIERAKASLAERGA